MTMYFLGINCFKIQSKNAILITDPFGKETGLKPVRAKADVITISNNDLVHNYISGIQGNPFIIDCPGEYEIKGVFIQGIIKKDEKNAGKNIIYLIEMDDIRILHLGDLNTSLTEEDRDKFDGIDVLIIPVGEENTLKINKAVEIINQVEPKIVIPMHYNLPGLKLKDKLSSLSKFCEEMGISEKNKLDKLSLKKKDLPKEETEVYILKQI